MNNELKELIQKEFDKVKQNPEEINNTFNRIAEYLEDVANDTWKSLKPIKTYELEEVLQTVKN